MSRTRADKLGVAAGGLPWGAPWGLVGRASSTSTQNVTVLADVTSLTTTFTATAGRVYKVDWVVGGSAAGALIATATAVLDAATVGEVQADFSVAGNRRTVTGVAYFTTTSGSHTLKITANVSASTWGLLGGTINHQLIVVDVGPS